jgi:Tfp pilus assembly protein PilZ
MALKITNIRKFLAQDKRKSERLRLPLKIVYILPSGKKWTKAASLEDISGRGLKFASNEKIELGAEVNLKITFADEPDKPVLADASVLRCDRVKPRLYRIAVKFHKMNHNDRRRYVEYLCENILLAYLKE